MTACFSVHIGVLLAVASVDNSRFACFNYESSGVYGEIVGGMPEKATFHLFFLLLR